MRFITALALTAAALPAQAVERQIHTWSNNYSSVAGSDELLAMTNSKSTAEGGASAEPKLWSGDFALGYNLTDGNSNEESLKFHSVIKRDRAQWHYELVTDATNTETEGVRTAEKYFASNRLGYDYSENNYTFGYLAYEADRFSGFRYKATVAGGYGRRLINRETMKWDAEVGPGYRRSEVTADVPGENDSEDVILRLFSQFQWTLSPSAVFEQRISVEGGADNTFSKSVTSIKSKVVGNLALKLSYTVDYNEEVPAGRKHADTATSVTVVYSF